MSHPNMRSNIGPSWVNPAIEIREAGEKGIGSFLTCSVRKGEIMVIQGGRIIEADLLDTPEYTPYAYHCFQIEKDFYITPPALNREQIDGIFNVNHSCDPTCGVSGQITLVAMRDLEVGDEITFDYAMSDMGSEEEGWEPMECLCGTSQCRHTITGSDWQIPELQDRYRGYFSQYIQNRIN